MLALNIEFQEEYKRLDRLCKDYLSSSEGVSEYIRQMERMSWQDRSYAATWYNDYNQLKHLRWIRNQLAHEVDTLNSDICQSDDLDWLKEFYTRILNGNDPFTIVRKAKSEETRRISEQKRAKETSYADNSETTPSKPSFWKILIESIKEIFSFD